jgi:hypothetical protein
MRGVNWIAAALAALALVGCMETAAQKEGTRISTSVQSGLDNIKACNERIYASDQYQALKDKMPPNAGDVPMSYLTNKTRVTPKEAALLVSLHEQYIAPCRHQAIDDAARAHPAYGAVMAQSMTQADVAYAKLIQGQSTWGEFAQASIERRAGYRTAMTDADAKIKQQLANAHAYEMHQREVLAASLRDMAFQEQVIAAMNRPVTVDCIGRRPYVTCTGR